MKQYTKGKARLRIEEAGNDEVFITYTHNGKVLSYFWPKTSYMNLVNFIRIEWMKDTWVIL